MTVTEALKDSYNQATGKVVDLAVTDSKGAKLLAIFNRLNKVWGEEDWRSMRSTFTLASTVSATNTFSFSSLTTLDHVSQQEGDFVRIYHTDNTSESDYSIVPIERLYEDGTIVGGTGPDLCSIVGTNIVFNGSFSATDSQFGGSIKLPGYLVPTALSAGADTIQVDDPYWLTTQAAAEFVFTDRTRVQLYDALLERAQKRWDKMKMANDSQVEVAYTPWAPLGESF